MIVVDTNVIAYLYLPTEFSANAQELLEQDADWAAPILWRSEFRNVLAGYLRRKQFAFDHALDIQRKAEILLNGAEFEVESDVVLELVRDSDCSAYDCEFIALAVKLNTTLFTMDKQLLRAFPNRTRALCRK